MVGDERVTLVAGCDDGFADNGGMSAVEVGAAFKENYADEFPDLRIYTNHKDMLAAHPDLDILTVAVSDHRHADIVVDAANSGHVKAIFCEKPLATTMEDTERMLDACERNNVIISVDHTRRFLPIWRYTKEQLVDKGVIGEVQYLIARACQPPISLLLLTTLTACISLSVRCCCRFARAEGHDVAQRHSHYRLPTLVC